MIRRKLIKCTYVALAANGVHMARIPKGMGYMRCCVSGADNLVQTLIKERMQVKEKNGEGFLDLRICDNLELMAEIKDNTIDLIYSDILYGTGRNFGEYQDLKPKREVIESHYLPRLIEMKRVLKQNGSIYLQMDTRINHWMRILMDKVFGYDNFRNEITWAYDKWSNVSNCFQRNHDVIVFYSYPNSTFNEERELINKPRKRNLVEIIDGKKVSKRVNGKIVYKEQFDRPISDVWTDIPRIPNTGKKVIGYPTQKPKELIKRVVLASSNEGDVVADYYLGSGTTAEVCKELNRNFIGCDINPNAIELTKTRLNAGT